MSRHFETAIAQIAGKSAVLCGADFLNIAWGNTEAPGQYFQCEFLIADIAVYHRADQPPGFAGSRRHRLDAVVGQNQVDQPRDGLAEIADFGIAGGIARARQQGEVCATRSSHSGAGVPMAEGEGSRSSVFERRCSAQTNDVGIEQIL